MREGGRGEEGLGIHLALAYMQILAAETFSVLVILGASFSECFYSLKRVLWPISKENASLKRRNHLASILCLVSITIGS